MEKLGVAVVGPGWVAGEHIKGYVQNKNTEIKAIVGMIPQDREKTEKYQQKYNFKCDYTEEYEAVLKRDDIKIISICTINYLHFEQALKAIEAGKHVFVEKPLAFKWDEIKKLVSATNKYKVKTQVGHVARWYPAIRSIKAFIDEGGIGDIFYGESAYWHEVIGEWKTKIKTGGSALLMGGCHAVDMIRYLMGEDKEVDEVYGVSIKPFIRKEFEYDPSISLFIKFKDGTLGKVATSLECNMPYVFHIQINGTKGAIRNNSIYSEKFPGNKDFMKLPAEYPDDWNVSHHPFPEEVDYFVDCILNDKESQLSFPRAALTYEIIFAAEESARIGKPIKLPLK